jgi:hypothetical protein
MYSKMSFLIPFYVIEGVDLFKRRNTNKIAILLNLWMVRENCTMTNSIM